LKIPYRISKSKYYTSLRQVRCDKISAQNNNVNSNHKRLTQHYHTQWY